MLNWARRILGSCNVKEAQHREAILTPHVHFVASNIRRSRARSHTVKVTPLREGLLAVIVWPLHHRAASELLVCYLYQDPSITCQVWSTSISNLQD
jgi:hypothetical protein